MLSTIHEQRLDSDVTVPVPRMLRYSDIPTAADTLIDAFIDTPLYRYLLETPDAKDTGRAHHRTLRRVDNAAFLTSFVNKGHAWTIDDGQAVVCYKPAKDSNPGWSWTDVFDHLQPLASMYMKKVVSTKEQKKRLAEIEEKMKKTVETTLGSRQDSLMYLSVAATVKAKQGRGYGSTLVRVVTAKADEQARSMWLITSNPVNIGFYNTFGFQTQADFRLGDDNPTWKEPPVVVTLMVREYNDSC